MTVYKVIVSDRAEKALGRLDRVIQRRVVRAIDDLKKDPMRKSNVKRLIGSDLYRLRVGDYRVIFSVEDQPVQIRIIALGHRREVYR